jgi:Phosphotransferase enzyme family
MSVRLWTSEAWRDQAVGWIDRRLADARLERTGAVEQPRVRPWATVLRAPTTGGVVWMKAAGPATAFEAGLYELLAREVPEQVLAPLAIDAPRGWMLLPDGGPPIGERLDGDALAAAMADALAQYGRLQRALAPRAGELPPLGVPDMRPEVMPERFAEALDAARASAPSRPPTGAPSPSAASPAGVLAEVEALSDDVARWCERLAASPVPASLDHNDLHQQNVLGTGPYRFYDWGDAVLAHAFAALLVPAQVLPAPQFERARDGYLAAFADLAPPTQLADELELACRVARIARTLTWERALRSAREQDEPIDPFFGHAPFEELTGLLVSP